MDNKKTIYLCHKNHQYMIYKIVQGNSFKMHVLVRKIDISDDFHRLVDFDLSEADGISVDLIGGFSQPTSTKVAVAGVQSNVLICEIPATLDIGVYSIRVSFQYKGSTFTSTERNFLKVVDHNSQSSIPIGIVEGETTGILDLRYYIVTQNQSKCFFAYALDDVTLSEQPDMMNNGESFTTTLTPAEGFNLGLVKVIMNGKDITHLCYKDGIISIPALSDYVTIMANGDPDACYYGSSAASEICQLNTENLSKFKGDLVGLTVNVRTTTENPYVWFVTHVPVVFTQAGIDTPMHHTLLGDLHYYWSDQLSEGENIYTIKLK